MQPESSRDLSTSVGQIALPAQPNNISNIARKGIQPDTRAQLASFGFDISTVQAQSSYEQLGDQNFRRPMLLSFSIGRSSYIPRAMVDEDPSIADFEGEFRVAVCAFRDGNKAPTIRREAYWTGPEGAETTGAFARAHRTDDGVWEFNLSRRAQPVLRDEVSELEPEVWDILEKARSEAAAAYDATRPERSPQELPPHYRTKSEVMGGYVMLDTASFTPVREWLSKLRGEGK